MAGRTAQQQVAMIGLGAMGTGMALNLQEDLKNGGKDRQLLVYNRTAAKMEPLVAAGADRAETLEDLAKRSNIIFSMLGSDAALEQVFKAVAAAGPPASAIFVDCSTVLPATTTKLAQQAADARIGYLSCPLFGRPDAVKARKTVMVMSGPSEAKARVRPLLEPLGRGVLDIGDSATQGSVMKLVGNFFIASAIELLAEGMTLGDAAGLPRDALLQYLHFMMPGIIFEGYGSRLAADDFDRKGGAAGFAVDMGLKDASHIKSLAEGNKVAMPVIDLVLRHLRAAQAAGRGDWDWGSLATAVREESGRPATGKAE